MSDHNETLTTPRGIDLALTETEMGCSWWGAQIGSVPVYLTEELGRWEASVGDALDWHDVLEAALAWIDEQLVETRDALVAALTPPELEQPKTYWLAETRNPPTLYAPPPPAGYPTDTRLTPHAHEAQRFVTRQACLSFCCGTYASVFLPAMEPREHMDLPEAPR